MSIDLAWDALLRSSLASSLADMLNRQLSNTQRPSFIGPVTVTSFEFGNEPPDVEIVDIRDIYRDFLEDEEEEEANENGRGGTGGVTMPGKGDEDGFEWISRRTAGMGLAEEAPTYHHLPPHVRYGKGPSADPFLGLGVTNSRNPLSLSVPNLSVGHGPMSAPPSGMFRSMLSTPTTPWSAFPYSNLPPFSATSTPPPQTVNSVSLSPANGTPPKDENPSSRSPSPPSPTFQHPNLQLHFRINHQSNLRLTLTTSLLINYPSPSFMSLPIKLSVTGIVFTGEVVLAYEGSRSRVHVCILDDLDPYGPAGDRSGRRDSTVSTDQQSSSSGSNEAPYYESGSGKPLPIGMRLLPSILIESEIGQADKHVLKNVTRVERFIQDVIRKTVEEELLFPNYHTIILGGES